MVFKLTNNYGSNNPVWTCFHFLSLFIVFILSNQLLWAQNIHESVWYVGNKKLNFNSSPLSIKEIETPILYGKLGAASVVDGTGNLLLFASSTEMCVYDNKLQILKNGDSLALLAKRYNNIFIPKPGNDTLFYLFSIEKYSIIDVKNGLVVNKNITWHSNKKIDSNNYIRTIQHSNCLDFWLVTESDDAHQSYLLTIDGISDEVVHRPRLIISHNCTFSPSGNYYLISGNTHKNNDQRDTVALDYGMFDRSSGKLTNTSLYKFNTYYACFATAFSSDETKLYLFMEHYHNREAHLLQIEIKSGVPDFSNAEIIYTYKLSGLDPISSMALGINNKIYHVFYLKRKINIIHAPNISGTDCNYEDNAISNIHLIAAPNLITAYCNDYSLDFTISGFCTSLPLRFSSNKFMDIHIANWHFGDNQTSTELSPIHTYTQAGKYTVSVEITYTDNTTETIRKEIEIYEKPQKPIIKYNVE